MANNSTRYVPFFDVLEDGTFKFERMIDVSLHKECPNCYVMFLKEENVNKIVNAKGEVVSFCYKCPVCGCRIKKI